MTQHEYIFIAISVILGLAMSRLLNSAAGLVRARKRITFHWATAVWGGCVLIYILQLWWVGWELRSVADWTIIDFFVLVLGAIFIYGSAELSLPVEDYDVSDDQELDFLQHSRTLGRISALSMLGYFAVGPYVNLTMFSNPLVPSIVAPMIGGAVLSMIILRPKWFQGLAVIFAFYTLLIVYLTA